MDRITATALDLADVHLDELSNFDDSQIREAAGEPRLTDQQCSEVRDQLDWLAGYLRQAAKNAPTEAADRLREHLELEQPGRWELPAEPGPEVAQLWDGEGVQWTRTAPLTWTRTDEPYDPWWNRWNWTRLLSRRGPLSATPPETAGGGQ